MKLHIIVDYSFLYYKYKFQLDSGRMRRLFCNMEWNGEVIAKDISQIYYSLREIEGFRRDWESKGHDVTMSICFDMSSSRKSISTEQSEKYKSNRVSKLDTNDFDNIAFVQKILNNVNYNTYKFEGYEADDLITYLVNTHSGSFDGILIYTVDADLIINLSGKVAVMRYKSGKQYTLVNIDNFEDYLSTEFKCNIPYNALMLYKCTVGDKSDCIDGIRGFGPAAFTKYISYLKSKNIDFTLLKTFDVVYNTLINSSNYFKQDQLNQALHSLDLVKPLIPSNDLMQQPILKSNKSFREVEYTKYKMLSLID